ncbi:hypothetical protein ACS0TY_003329 [Phlomoides rotata]
MGLWAHWHHTLPKPVRYYDAAHLNSINYHSTPSFIIQQASASSPFPVPTHASSPVSSSSVFSLPSSSIYVEEEAHEAVDEEAPKDEAKIQVLFPLSPFPSSLPNPPHDVTETLLVEVDQISITVTI